MDENAVSWERVEREIAKCSVRCANCHRRVTAERAGTWRQRAWNDSAADQHAAARTRLEAVLA